MTRASRPGGKLTELEITVLRLTAEGHSFPAIGKLIGRSTAAVQDTRQRVIIKLGAQSSAHAVLIACRAGVLDGRRQRHGDHSGFNAHKKRGEDPCDECVEGERTFQRDRSRARRAAQQPSAATRT